jgi:hypothetical protein
VHPGNTILHSTDGTEWTVADTNDLPSIQQADAPIDALGYVAVARDPSATTAPGLTNDESSSIATIAISVGLVVLAAAAGVTLWGPSIRRGRRMRTRGKKKGRTNRRPKGSARGSRRPR